MERKDKKKIKRGCRTGRSNDAYIARVCWERQDTHLYINTYSRNLRGQEDRDRAKGFHWQRVN